MTLPSASVTKPGTVIDATRLRARISGSGWDTSGGPVGPRLLDRRPRAPGPGLAMAGQQDVGLDALEAVEGLQHLGGGDVEGRGLDARAALPGQRVVRDDLVADEQHAV